MVGAGSSVQLLLLVQVSFGACVGGGGVEPGSGAWPWGVSDTLLGPEGSGRPPGDVKVALWGVGWLLVASFVLSVPCASLWGGVGGGLVGVVFVC